MIPTEILNYVIIRKIGEGGMGQVFLARNKSIGQLVAIKMLHPRYGNNPLLRQKLRQEAIVLSSLNHPNIVKFLNYVETDAGVFLIMEYVEGMTLEDFINKKNGLIVESKAYPMMSEILDAFAYAHGRGIIHRDIKPSNIYINAEGHIKVLDFGIAQILSESGSEIENRGGTPSYMSPEQVLDKNVDIRSDIYSLGVMFHQMLTGKAPFDTTTLSHVEIKQEVLTSELKRMKEFYPYISDGMQKVIDIATRKNPADRYSNCAEFRKAIDKVLNPSKGNRPLIIGAAALGAVLLIAGFFIWDYMRVKVKYYNDYAEVWEVPVGIGKVSASEMRHREATYRMEYSKGKLRRMTLVNSADRPTDHNDSEFTGTRYSDVEYFYADNGRVDFKKIYDSHGKLLFKIDYDENLKTESLKHDDEYGTPMRIDSNTTNLFKGGGTFDESKASITHFLLTHDEETGLLTMKRYAGNNNERIGDSDNIYGIAYEHDDKGRVTKSTYLDIEDKPRNNKIGLGVKKFSYDDDDLWVGVTYHSIDGKPSHDGNNSYQAKFEYDRWGNKIAEKYFDSKGMPSLRTDMGTFGLVCERDDRGNEVKRTYIDGKGKPMACSSGYVSVVSEYDGDCNPVTQKFVDGKGSPVFGALAGEPVASIGLKYDEKGRVTESRFFDKSGKPSRTTSGYSIMKLGYDTLGNLRSTRYYDEKGNSAYLNGKIFEITSEYDKLGRLISQRNLDKKGKPSKDENGVCGTNFVYDRNGNLAELCYVGPDGKTSTVNNLGIATVRYKYDETGNETSREFFNAQGNPVLCNGFSKVEFIYDPKSNFLIEIRRYTPSGLREIEKSEYDSRGNIIKNYTTGASGALLPGGVVTLYKYDDNGRMTESTAANLNGRKVNVPGTHYSTVKYKHDDLGNVSELSFYDVNGAKACDNLNTHIRIHKFDASNRVVYEKNLGKDGKPARGGNASAEGKVEYDERGNRTAVYCYDGYGKPALSHIGAHKESYRYDDMNHQISEEYSDTSGKLVNVDKGYARAENAYDKEGNIVSQKYYLASGTLKADLRYEYNSKNNLKSARVYGPNGRLDDSFYGGLSQVELTYVEDGTVPHLKIYKNARGMTLATERYNKSTDSWTFL